MRVSYLGLYYDGHDTAWDFGDWHWPEVGVELERADGQVFHAIWGSEVAQFDLSFRLGPIAADCRLGRQSGVMLASGWLSPRRTRTASCPLVSVASRPPA